MNDPQKRALALLVKITSATTNTRALRTSDLLCSTAHRPPFDQRPGEWDEGWCEGWAFPVHPSLAAALDIQLTPRKAQGKAVLEWTQGSAFDFRAGYAVYNAPRACDMPWAEQAPPISVALQIIKASCAVPESKDSPRNPGSVTFEQRRIEDGWMKAETFSMSQDDFVRLLISGEKP